MSRRLTPFLQTALLAACFNVAGCGPSAAPEPGAGPALASTPTPPITIGVDGADNRGATLAASGARVVVAWAAIAGDTTNIYAAVSDDGGRAFGAPARVNDVSGDARVNGEQPPRVAVNRDAVVIVFESRQAGKSRVRLSRSTDGGRTFQPAITVHEEALSGARGWASVALDDLGVAHVAWLDGRHATSAPAHEHGATSNSSQAHESHGSMRQDIYQAVVQHDGTRTETAVATDVCFCCKTSVGAAADGTTYVAWRHIYPVSIRDIAIARSSDGGKTFGVPVRVSEDRWKIDGCPEDGPSIAVGDAGMVHIAWPTFVTDGQNASDGSGAKAVFYSSSRDAGRTFAGRERVDAGDNRGAGHPQLAVAGTRAVVAWDELHGSERWIVMRYGNTAADRFGWTGQTATVIARGSSEYPAPAIVTDGVVLAWTENVTGASRVRVQRIAK